MNKILISSIIGFIIVMGALNGLSLFSDENNKLNTITSSHSEDFDPFVDIAVTVDILKIRSLEKSDMRLGSVDKIDPFSDPDFYVKVFINNQEFISPTWENQKYVYDPQWSATLNVPDDVELVNITIQLWDNDFAGDKQCDISDNHDDYPGSLDIDLLYSIKTGHWFGEDYVFHEGFWGAPDPSGYGRLNGCDDNSVYQNNRDCELWFDIYQNDFDNDKIPYWTEVNIYNTSTHVNNIGEDHDGDGVPIEWEHKWGHYFYWSWWRNRLEHFWIYSPNEWEDHKNMDSDDDGLNNVEEYLTSQWGSDPFRKDIFIELDQMDAGSDGEPASILTTDAKELLQTAYNKHNIVYHLDDGSMGGGEIIPFDLETSGRNELSETYYNNYFLHNGEHDWKQGIFRYGVVVYDAGFNGYAVRGDMWQISSKYVEEKSRQLFFVDKDIVYASVYMHETGHSLDIYNPGVDNQNTYYPWQLDYWKYRPYRSCMNYGYTYILVDYSDGSRGMNDFDDWNDLDLSAFDDWYD